MRKGLTAVWRDAIGESSLTATEKLVAYALSTWMNARGSCYPSRASIAGRSSLSVRAAERAVRRLEAAGWVAVSRGDGGRGRTNRYVALLPETANEVRRSEWERANLTTGNGEPHDTNGERGSPESALKARESERVDAAAPDGASSTPFPEDTCSGCGEVHPLVDDRSLYCETCAKAAA